MSHYGLQINPTYYQSVVAWANQNAVKLYRAASATHWLTWYSEIGPLRWREGGGDQNRLAEVTLVSWTPTLWGGADGAVGRRSRGGLDGGRASTVQSGEEWVSLPWQEWCQRQWHGTSKLSNPETFSSYSSQVHFVRKCRIAVYCERGLGSSNIYYWRVKELYIDYMPY